MAPRRPPVRMPTPSPSPSPSPSPPRSPPELRGDHGSFRCLACWDDDHRNKFLINSRMRKHYRDVHSKTHTISCSQKMSYYTESCPNKFASWSDWINHRNVYHGDNIDDDFEENLDAEHGDDQDDHEDDLDE